MDEHRCVPHYVYRLLDEDGHLLYVGCTKNVAKRLRQWSASLDEWTYCIRSVHVTSCADKATARTAESAAIKTEHPLWNTLGVYSHLHPSRLTPDELITAIHEARAVTGDPTWGADRLLLLCGPA